MAPPRKVPQGGSLSQLYTPPQDGLRQTHSYRTANQWLKIAEQTQEILKDVGDIDATRRRNNNEEARKAGVLAEVRGQIFESTQKPKDRYERKHWTAGYYVSQGERKARVYDSFRRTQAKTWGEDPQNIKQDYAAFETEQRRKWMSDNGVVDDLAVLAFESELNKNSVAHHTIQRTAQEATIRTTVLNNALEKTSDQIHSLSVRKSTLYPYQHNEDGSLTRDPDTGQPIKAASARVVTSTETVEKGAAEVLTPENRDSLTGQLDHTQIAAHQSQLIQEQAGLIQVPETKKVYWGMAADDLISKLEMPYTDALARANPTDAAEFYNDYVGGLDQILLWKKEDGTTVWNAEQTTKIQKMRQKLINEHDVKMSGLPTFIAQKAERRFLEAVLPHFSKYVPQDGEYHTTETIMEYWSKKVVKNEGTAEEQLVPFGVAVGIFTQEQWEDKTFVSAMAQLAQAKVHTQNTQKYQHDLHSASAKKRTETESNEHIADGFLTRLYGITGDTKDKVKTFSLLQDDINGSTLPDDASKYGKHQLLKQLAERMNYLDFTQPSQEQAVQLVRTYITEHVTQDLKENAEASWWKSAMQDHQFAGFMKEYWKGHPEVSGQLDNNIVQRMIGEYGLPESQSAAFLYRPRTITQQAIQGRSLELISTSRMKTQIHEVVSQLAEEAFQAKFPPIEDESGAKIPQTFNMSNIEHRQWANTYLKDRLSVGEIMGRVLDLPGEWDGTSFEIPENWYRGWIPTVEEQVIESKADSPTNPPLPATDQQKDKTQKEQAAGTEQVSKTPALIAPQEIPSDSYNNDTAGQMVFTSYAPKILEQIDSLRKQALAFEQQALDVLGDDTDIRKNPSAQGFMASARRYYRNADALEMVLGANGGVNANNGAFNWHNAMSYSIQEELGPDGAINDTEHPLHFYYKTLNDWYSAGLGTAVMPREMVRHPEILMKGAFFGLRDKYTEDGLMRPSTPTEIHADINEQFQDYLDKSADGENFFQWVDNVFLQNAKPRDKRKILTQIRDQQLMFANIAKLPETPVVATTRQEQGFTLTETRRRLFHGVDVPWSFKDTIGANEMVNILRQREQTDRLLNRNHLIKPPPGKGASPKYYGDTPTLHTNRLFPQDSLQLDEIISTLSAGRAALVASDHAERIPAHHIPLIFMQEGIRGGELAGEDYLNIVKVVPDRMKEHIFTNPDETDYRKLIALPPKEVRDNYETLLANEIAYQRGEGTAAPLLMGGEGTALVQEVFRQEVRKDQTHNILDILDNALTVSLQAGHEEGLKAQKELVARKGKPPLTAIQLKNQARNQANVQIAKARSNWIRESAKVRRQANKGVISWEDANPRLDELTRKFKEDERNLRDAVKAMPDN